MTEVKYKVNKETILFLSAFANKDFYIANTGGCFTIYDGKPTYRGKKHQFSADLSYLIGKEVLLLEKEYKELINLYMIDYLKFIKIDDLLKILIENSNY